MKEIVFYGAAGEVTGSRTIITANNETRYGVDRGSFQGSDKEENDRRNLESNDSNDPDITIISHGHLDHVGLVHQTKNRVLTTAPTRDLLAVNIEDAEDKSPFLYPRGSRKNTLNRIECVNFGVPLRVDGSTAEITENGHVLGSGSVILRELGGDIVVFSGDLGPRNSRTVSPATPIKGGADIVVVEGTYGDEIRPTEDPLEVFEYAINWAYKNHGDILISSFALDRLQSVLNIIKELKIRRRIPDLPFYLDAPMGIRMTEIYMKYHHLLRPELREQKDPFNFPKLILTKDWRDSEKIDNYRKSKGIIAGGGMGKGGRIETHLLNKLSNPRNVYMIIGYPTEGTPNRAILDGEKEIQIGNEWTTVGAHIVATSSMSAHADQQGDIDWIEQFMYGDRRLRTVFVNHCEKEKGEALADKIRAKFGIDVIIPKQGQSYSLQ